MNYLRVILFLWAHVCYCLIYNILPKVLGHLLLINRFDYFSNFQEYKSYDAYNDILGNCVLLILLVWTGTLFYSNMTVSLCLRQGSKRNND